MAGTHGKTTTTSMLAMVLAEAGLEPSFVVGGDVHEVGTGAHWSGGRWLVVEADESDGTHLELPLAGTILTNVEADHLDHYGTFEAVVDAFDRYLAQVDGPKVLCADDPVTAVLAARHDAVTYGIDADARYQARDIGTAEGALRFVVDRDGAELGEVVVPLRGLHNVRNALGAIAMADAVGVPFAATARALARFGGVARRFDVRARHEGITLVDDYAHLPGEIAAVLAAAAGSGDGWTRCVAVFQPNRYNRMAVLSPEYARRVRRRRRDRHHRHLPVGPGADPRCDRQAGGGRGVRRASRSSGSCGCPSGPTSWPSSSASSARVTCASRWAAATSPSSPTRCSPVSSGRSARERPSGGGGGGARRRHPRGAGRSARHPSVH